MRHDDQTPADLGDGIDLFGPQYGSGTDERRVAKRANKSLNGGKWGGRIERHLDDLKACLDQSRANRHCLVGSNPAQDGNEWSSLQTCPKRRHPYSFRRSFPIVWSPRVVATSAEITSALTPKYANALSYSAQRVGISNDERPVAAAANLSVRDQ